MTLSDLIKYRLVNQQIAGTKFKEPVGLVAWMGAMQAQDFGMAKWAIGLRLREFGEATVENAFNSGTILRTHVLRPTWHFVVPQDIRWMLELTAPHIIPLLAYNDRRIGLNKKIVARSNEILTKELQGGKQLTRDELRIAFKKVKIATDDLRFTHLLIHAELAAVICSGPRKGKQFTYALLEERAPQAKLLKRDEALAELTKRYFVSRGPATLQDFAWWSGLPMTDVKKGMEMVKSYFERENVDGREYFFKPSALMKKDVSQSTHLLPNYDEYTVAYKDRSMLLEGKDSEKPAGRGDTIFNNTILINGRVEGTWQRVIKNNSVAVKTKPFTQLNKTKQQAVIKAAKRYSEFIGKSLK